MPETKREISISTRFGLIHNHTSSMPTWENWSNRAEKFSGGPSLWWELFWGINEDYKKNTQKHDYVERIQGQHIKHYVLKEDYKTVSTFKGTPLTSMSTYNIIWKVKEETWNLRANNQTSIVLHEVEKHTYHPGKSFRVVFQGRCPVLVNSFLHLELAGMENIKTDWKKKASGKKNACHDNQ